MNWGAAAATAIATYRMAEASAFNGEGVASWVIAGLIGGALWGFIWNWIYNRWIKTPR